MTALTLDITNPRPTAIRDAIHEIGSRHISGQPDPADQNGTPMDPGEWVHALDSPVWRSIERLHTLQTETRPFPNIRPTLVNRIDRFLQDASEFRRMASRQPVSFERRDPGYRRAWEATRAAGNLVHEVEAQLVQGFDLAAANEADTVLLGWVVSALNAVAEEYHQVPAPTVGAGGLCQSDVAEQIVLGNSTTDVHITVVSLIADILHDRTEIVPRRTKYGDDRETSECDLRFRLASTHADFSSDLVRAALSGRVANPLRRRFELLALAWAVEHDRLGGLWAEIIARMEVIERDDQERQDKYRKLFATSKE